VELMTSLARVVYMYEMRLAHNMFTGEGNPDLEWGRQRKGEYQLMDSFTSLKDGPFVEFREREM
jgi:hypothetical protein